MWSERDGSCRQRLLSKKLGRNVFGAVTLEVVRSLAKRNSNGESVCQMRVSESKATLAEVVVNG